MVGPLVAIIWSGEQLCAGWEGTPGGNREYHIDLFHQFLTEA